MLHLIPAPLHRRLLRIAHAVRVRWWRWARPRLVDCRVIALDAAGRVLLVRHSYGSGEWMPPGGRPRRAETPVAAAARELREETGCALAHPAEVAAPAPGAERTLFVVVGRLVGEPRADGREVIDARLFGLDALPRPASPQLPRRLARWVAAYMAHSNSG